MCGGDCDVLFTAPEDKLARVDGALHVIWHILGQNQQVEEAFDRSLYSERVNAVQQEKQIHPDYIIVWPFNVHGVLCF